MTTINQVKNYWNRQPCNIKHSNKLVGFEEWSEEVTKRKYFVEPHIRQFADFPKWRFHHVLELGCGIGTDTLEFIKNHAFVCAIDISEKSLSLAKLRISYLVSSDFNPLASFYCGNIESIDHSYQLKNFYDLVYAFGVVHHTPNPRKVIDNVFFCLKPGGEFRMMVYAKWSIKNLFRIQPEAQAGCPIVTTYTKKNVTNLLYGFDIVSIKKDFIFPWRIEDYKEYRYVKEWYYRWMPKWLFHRLEKLLGWHLLIVARKPK